MGWMEGAGQCGVDTRVTQPPQIHEASAGNPIPVGEDERDQLTAASCPCVLPSILGQIRGETISGNQKGLDPPGLPRGHVGAGAFGFGPHWRLHSRAEEDLPAGTVCPTPMEVLANHSRTGVASLHWCPHSV